MPGLSWINQNGDKINEYWKKKGQLKHCINNKKMKKRFTCVNNFYYVNDSFQSYKEA